MAREPLADVLNRLRVVVQAQAAALDEEDFPGVAEKGIERDALVAALDQYRGSDLRPEDRGVLEQIAAIDQRLVASAQQGLDEANLTMRSLFRGQGALQKYQRRGQQLIGALHQLDVAR